MACCHERQLDVLNTEINTENEGAGETIEEGEQEPELPSVSTFLEVGLDLESPTPLEFDHHGETIIRHNTTRSVSIYEELHTKSQKQMSAPTLRGILDEKLPENSTEKQGDIRSEKKVMLKGVHDRCVNSWWNVKNSKVTSRIPILVKTRQAKKPRITESVHSRKVTHSRSHLPVLIKRKVKKPDTAEVVHDKKATDAGRHIRSPNESKTKKPNTAGVVQSKIIPNAGSRIPLPIKSKVKKSNITEAVLKKAAKSESRIPLAITKTKSISKSNITKVEHSATHTKMSRLPVPIQLKVENQIIAKAVQQKNVTKRSRIPTSIKMKVSKPKVEEKRYMYSHKENVTNRHTVKVGSQKPTHGNKRSTKNAKVDKTDKGEKYPAKEITRDPNDKIKPQRKTVDLRQTKNSNSKIANMSGQNKTRRNSELNKCRADENRKSMGYRNCDQRGRDTKEMKENSTRSSGKMKTNKKTILNKEDTLFSQDCEIGGCMPKLQALSDMKDVLAKQINDMKKEIGDLKKPDAEARVAPTPTGVYTPEMFDDDSDRIQVDIWEIKRQIITMKYLDQSTFAKLESRIMDVKGANKELEGNLKRIKFTQEHDVKKESGAIVKDTEMSCSDQIIGETHKIPRPPSDKKPRGKFTRKRLLKH